MMARKLLSTVTVTVFSLLFLFALANARAPLDQPGNDVSVLDVLTDLPDSDRKTTHTIFLPSERPETDPATVVEHEPETNDESKQPEPETTVDEAETKDEAAESEEATPEEPQTAPLTLINFRPINRHYFPRRPSLHHFRHHRRGCHHHRRFKPWGPRREISYGNDMIHSWEGGENGRLENIGRRAPERQWAGTFENRGGPKFWVFRGDDAVTGRDEEFKMSRPRHHHFSHFHHHHDHPRLMEDEGEFEERDHEHHHKHEHKHKQDHGREEEEGGIFTGIRKYLNSHF